ncbi:Odorant receptor 131-2 [Merluccius polli]|uniref:Odorant receptor 131-2 n=1 Tax=Merluccius polli TaxID=89951 RepID=A0AA47MWF4_MERPO|nr:Odorant receptor 131-2 [Merluccius polli]
MRYIFFVFTLMSDSLYLLVTNVLLLMSFFHAFMQVWLCVFLIIVLSMFNFVFPITLTAMTLERYVAICMPMRHGALCTPRSALHCILIIHTISSIPISIIVSIYFASVPHSIYMEDRMCRIEMLMIHKWQSYLFLAANQLYFVIMFVIIVFCYIEITKAARKASGETKKSTGKGLRTFGDLHLQPACFTPSSLMRPTLQPASCLTPGYQINLFNFTTTPVLSLCSALGYSSYRCPHIVIVA